MPARKDVIAAGQKDMSHLAGLATAYTWDTAAAAWLIPEVENRSMVLMAWYSLVIEQALRHGHADSTIDRGAAAIWVDNTEPPLALPHYLARLTAACGRYAIALLEYQQLLDRCGPVGGHEQLMVLAADGDAAAKLLDHRHRSLDRAGIPAFAAATNAKQAKVLIAKTVCQLGLLLVNRLSRVARW